MSIATRGYGRSQLIATWGYGQAIRRLISRTAPITARVVRRQMDINIKGYRWFKGYLGLDLLGNFMVNVTQKLSVEGSRRFFGSMYTYIIGGLTVNGRIDMSIAGSAIRNTILKLTVNGKKNVKKLLMMLNFVLDDEEEPNG